MQRPERAPADVREFVEDVYRRYGTSLHAFLRRRLSHPKDADDLAQEVYLRLIRTDQDKFIRNPQAYLYGIAGHVLSHFGSRRKRDSDRMELTAEPEDTCAPPTNPMEDEQAERLNLQKQLQAALKQLPARHAEILLCIKRDGLTYTETGRRMNLSSKAVERYFCEAKARLLMLNWDR